MSLRKLEEELHAARRGQQTQPNRPRPGEQATQANVTQGQQPRASRLKAAKPDRRTQAITRINTGLAAKRKAIEAAGLMPKLGGTWLGDQLNSQLPANAPGQQIIRGDQAIARADYLLKHPEGINNPRFVQMPSHKPGLGPRTNVAWRNNH